MAIINLRTTDNLKIEAQEILNALGLDLSTAIKLFLHQVVIVKGIPFELRTENGFTRKQERKILNDVKKVKNTIQKKEVKLHSTANDLICDILGDENNLHTAVQKRSKS